MTIDEILYSTNELLLVIEEFVALYRPKTREEAGVFYRMSYKLPDVVGLLSDLQKPIILDDDKFYDSVAPLKNTAIKLAFRIVSANVIINDIIEVYFELHEDDMYIYLLLTMLKWSKNTIYDDREKLCKIYNEVRILYPDLLVSDDDIEEEEGEEAVLPKDIESFQYMEDILIEALAKYISEHESGLNIKFFTAIQNYLKDFAEGIEPDNGFDFGFSLRSDYGQLQYVDFHFETEIIEVTAGGSILMSMLAAIVIQIGCIVSD